jgi:hypothetical protein
MYFALTGEIPFDYAIDFDENGTRIMLSDGRCLEDDLGEIKISLNGKHVDESKVLMKKHNDEVMKKVNKLKIDQQYKSLIQNSLCISEQDLEPVEGKLLGRLESDFNAFKYHNQQKRRETRHARFGVGIGAIILAGFFGAISQAECTYEISPDYHSPNVHTHQERWNNGRLYWLNDKIEKTLAKPLEQYKGNTKALDPVLAASLLEAYVVFNPEGLGRHGTKKIDYLARGQGVSSVPRPNHFLIKRLNFYSGQFTAVEDVLIATIADPNELYRARGAANDKDYSAVRFVLQEDTFNMVELALARYTQQKGITPKKLSLKRK